MNTPHAHSEYWLTRDWLKTMPHRESPEFAMRMASLRRSTADFVKIICGKDIPVKFSSGKQSYTDGSNIVVISAVTEPEKIDIMVGLALHEASHVLLSQKLFEFAQFYYPNPTQNKITASGKLLTEYQRLEKLNPTLGLTADQVHQFVHLMTNFLEDRRIDSWMYGRIGGYRPYYDAMYENYFFSPVIERALVHPEYRKPYMRCYEMHIINMMNKLADPTALPGLDMIHRVIDIRNIRRYDKGLSFSASSIPQIVQDAIRIAEIVFANAIPGEPEDVLGQDEEGEGEESELDNMDMGNGTGQKGKMVPGRGRKLSAKEVAEALEKQKAFTNGEIDKSELPGEVGKLMDQLESAGAKCKSVGDGLWKKPKAIVYQRVDETIAKSDLFPFGGHSKNSYSQEAVRKGTQMGNALAYRIRVLQDEYLLKFNRQNHGKLDKKALHTLGYGGENAFMLDQIIRMKPVYVHLTIDASGSMQGYRWKHAMTLAISLAVAASKTRNMDVCISIRAGIGYGRYASGEELVGVAVIYDSRVDKVQKIAQVFPYLHTAGGTPEGLSFEAIMDKIVLNQKEEVRKYFVNLSDGEPAFHGYGGESGVNHTRKQVEGIRRLGVKVLSYFVGDGYAEGDFRTMYGKDAVFIQPDSIPEIARTLNRLFMEE
jgi:hypothetical protein